MVTSKRRFDGTWIYGFMWLLELLPFLKFLYIHEEILPITSTVFKTSKWFSMGTFPYIIPVTKLGWGIIISLSVNFRSSWFACCTQFLGFLCCNLYMYFSVPDLSISINTFSGFIILLKVLSSVEYGVFMEPCFSHCIGWRRPKAFSKKPILQQKTVQNFTSKSFQVIMSSFAIIYRAHTLICFWWVIPSLADFHISQFPISKWAPFIIISF